MNESDTNQTEQDMKSTDFGTSQHWIDALKDSQNQFSEYHSKCDSIEKLYATLKQFPDENRKFQIFWSNIEVLKPAVYARTPVPVVVPRFKDLKELPRTASEMLERTLITNFELQDLDNTMKMARNDYLLFNRGVLWLRYKTEDGEEGVSSGDDMVDFAENVVVEHVSRRDFRHDPARKWNEVGWVAKRSFLTTAKVIARFGQKFAMLQTKKMKYGEEDAYGEAKAEIWEIWDKTSKKVIWVSPMHDEILDMVDPHLSLEGFFPCPRPCYGTTVNDSLVPVPDFVFYKDQVEEIDELTARISKLSEALKMKGFYAAGESELKDAIEAALANESNSAVLAPVSNMAALGNRSLKDSIVWLPVIEIAQIVQTLIGLRKQLVQDIYEITGISDIVRGATDPNETASAQKIKAQWGSVRIRERQGELARISRDTTRIMAEIMAENYRPETFVQMSQMDVATEEKIQQQAQQMQAGAQQHIAKLQQQPPQPQPQQGQPPRPQPPQPEQIMQQVQAKIAELQKTVTVEKIIKMFRDQRTRAFLIEIEVDSTIQPDEDGEKQRRTEFLTSIGGFINQVMPMVQQVPQTGTFAAEALRFATGGFRAGRQLEGVIDDMADQLEQMAKQPKQKGPTPEQQAEMAKAKADTQKLQSDHAANMKRLETEQLRQKAIIAKANSDMSAAAQPIQRATNDNPEDKARVQIAVERAKIEGQKELRAMDYEAKGIEIRQDGQPTTLEIMEPILQGLTQMMAQIAHQQASTEATTQRLLQAMSAPKEVVRDPETGDVLGVQPVLQVVN